MVRNPMELRIGRLHGLFVEHLLRDPGLREALPTPLSWWLWTHRTPS